VILPERTKTVTLLTIANILGAASDYPSLVFRGPTSSYYPLLLTAHALISTLFTVY